jgi:hypothetical protein
MPDFKPGDIVRLKGGSIELLVLSVIGMGIKCGMLPYAKGEPAVYVAPEHLERAGTGGDRAR